MSQHFACDLCGADQPRPIPALEKYTEGSPIHVCGACGFVYVTERRSFREIADDWSDDLYVRAEEGYTARIPAVQARLTYVAETIAKEIGAQGRLLDIGAGEGDFMAMMAARGTTPFGIEPSAANCKLIEEQGMAAQVGTIEDFAANPTQGGFDMAAILWTLEACQSCRGMIDAAHALLTDGGHLIIGTGSRLMVPFRKPLHYYVEPGRQDTHPFRFSAGTLKALLESSGFEVVFTNRFIDTEYLVMIGRKRTQRAELTLPIDNPDAVIDFFTRWDAETQAHYRAS